MNGKEPEIFETKSEAIKHVRKLNKELRDERNATQQQPNQGTNASNKNI
jgi:hypothetical protein